MDQGRASKKYTLREKEELRLEVCGENKTSLKLLTGSAEVFGTALETGQPVDLQNQKIAVFTWEGCTLQLDGTPDVVYTAVDTPMVAYINVHQVLHNRRQEASETTAQGPRTLVVGPPDSGKSSLCRMLLNWAARTGSTPTFIDLDVAQNSITPPGCLSAAAWEEPTDLEEGGTLQQDPLIYFYGHLDAARNPELYKFQMDRMAEVLERRAACAPDVSSAGLVVNTPAWMDSLGYELLMHAVTAFKVDVVLVLEQDRLYSQLQAELSSRKGAAGPLSVLKLNKSGGVVSKTDSDRRQARVAAVREYFYGGPRQQLSPHSQQMATSDFIVFSIGGGPRAPSHALPLGTVSAANPLRLMPVKVDRKLIHSLLAVSTAQLPDQLTTANIAGFVVVTDANEHVVTFLTPSRGPLPGRYLLEGSLVDSAFSEL